MEGGEEVPGILEESWGIEEGQWRSLPWTWVLRSAGGGTSGAGHKAALERQVGLGTIMAQSWWPDMKGPLLLAAGVSEAGIVSSQLET
jgi:hypothetical protein